MQDHELVGFTALGWLCARIIGDATESTKHCHLIQAHVQRNHQLPVVQQHEFEPNKTDQLLGALEFGLWVPLILPAVLWGRHTASTSHTSSHARDPGAATRYLTNVCSAVVRLRVRCGKAPGPFIYHKPTTGKKVV